MTICKASLQVLHEMHVGGGCFAVAETQFLEKTNSTHAVSKGLNNWLISAISIPLPFWPNKAVTLSMSFLLAMVADITYTGCKGHIL